MESYYFILGRENKISQTELQCVLASFDFYFEEITPRSSSEAKSEVGCKSISILSDQVLEIKLVASRDQVKNLIDILGGTVKIYQKIASSNEKIESLLSGENKSSKIIFGLSNYSGAKLDTFRMALSAKKAAKKSIRIINGKEDDKLSSAQSFQYKMDIDNVEYGVFETGIGKLIAVQNINEWTRHDYGKPKSDAKSGMLPPKLARMMVNLAIGQAGIKNNESGIMNENHNSAFGIHNSCLVVDPFCGSGNVLIEAISIGCEVVGSDLSEKAVSDSKANLEWFLDCHSRPDRESTNSLVDSRLRGNDIVVADATKFDFSTIDQDFVIATEPFLGQPRNSKLRIEEEKEVKEDTKRLYLDFLKNLQSAGSKLQTIAIVFPLFELANGKKLSIFDHCVDFIRDIGYTLIYPPMEYGREYQIVKRQIVILKLSADS
ncbi:MAG: hypothetical protein NTY30_01100 [Candidatus Berkelbacteria bacterium]|nr:hypothetical protein [Candidatus Berkelbacteria bacterium]